MNGVEFGQELKKIRKQAKIPSKQLAKKVGKGDIYVSQLERGIIKKPDFGTCFNLLKELNFPLNKIEDFLYNYGIMSKEREEAELQEKIKKADLLEKLYETNPEEYLKHHYPWLYDEKHDLSMVKRKVNNISSVFNSFIERDFTRANIVLNNLINLTKSKKSFDFFCSLFEYDFFNMQDAQKEQLISLIKQFDMDKTQIFDWEDE